MAWLSPRTSQIPRVLMVDYRIRPLFEIQMPSRAHG